ncbi:50S ribosomal protein L28 [Actinospica sp. MGRD01-02]|jgi:large subunit ribosomal protein L28|uniref:Large ribosomal subunit protein bL28 n=1 Tax=Actinospica acidithermotolerans TaxID=2828514 RepID=A0A941EAE1_9ACTN|nr:50S ribosomal protein L28 [Actinospica acidithermotolerans]MBR7826792.1 50S ribosomal protein L28 [Actinospica acidithermotolerans]
MARRCDICGKEPTFGKTISRLGKNAVHRRIKGRSSRRFDPNIQPVKTVVNGTPTRLKVCTSCLKAGKVERQASARG